MLIVVKRARGRREARSDGFGDPKEFREACYSLLWIRGIGWSVCQLASMQMLFGPKKKADLLSTSSQQSPEN